MTRPTSNDPLLAPFTLGKLPLRNRIVSTSHASMKDDGGMPGARYQAYHEAKARGGLAMTMIGGSAMVSRDSPHKSSPCFSLGENPFNRSAM